MRTPLCPYVVWGTHCATRINYYGANLFIFYLFLLNFEFKISYILFKKFTFDFSDSDAGLSIKYDTSTCQTHQQPHSITPPLQDHIEQCGKILIMIIDLNFILLTDAPPTHEYICICRIVGNKN